MADPRFCFSESRSLDFLKKLEKTASKHRKSTKLKRHQFDWRKEERNLNQETKSLEKQILGHLERCTELPVRGRARKLRRPHSMITRLRRSNSREEVCSREGTCSSRQRPENESASRREQLLKQAKDILSSPETNNEDMEKVPETLHETKGEISRISFEQEIENLMAETRRRDQLLDIERRETLAQVYGIRALLRQKQINQQPDKEQELVEIIYGTQQAFMAIGDSLHEEFKDAMADVMEAKTAIRIMERQECKDSEARKAEVLSKMLQEAKMELLECYGDEEEMVRIAEEYNMKVEEVENKKNKQLEQLESKKKVLLQQKKHKNTCGSNDQHELMVKLYKEIISRGRSREVFMERAIFEFPSRSKEEISNHLNWYENFRAILAQKQEILYSSHRQILEENERFLLIMKRTAHSLEIKQTRLAESEQQRAKVRDIHCRLEIAKKAWAEQKAISDAAEYERKQKEEQERLYQEEIERVEREHQKKLVNQYKQENALAEALERLRTEQFEAEQDEERKRLAPFREERVEYRKEQYKLKIEYTKEQVAVLEAKEEERQKLLDDLRTQVPYFKKISEIQPCAKRLNKNTFSLGVVPDAAYRNYNADGLFKKTGFTSDNICNDLRYKVMEKLRVSGLHQTSYAQTLLRSMNQHGMAQRNLQSTY